MKNNIITVLFVFVLYGCDQINNPSDISYTNLPIVYISNGQVTVINSDGTNNHTITSSNNWNDQPVFNKDKTKIVFESYRDEDTEIYVINSDGTNEKRLTNRPGIDEDPKFSPDGSKVIYSSSDFNICTIDIANHIEKELTSDGFNFSPSYSHDGLKIVYIHADANQGYQNLFIMDSGGENKKQLTTQFTDAVSPTFSYDVKYIAFVALEERLFIYDLLNNNNIGLTLDSIKVGFPHFTSDNNKIIFQGLVWPNNDIYSVNVDGNDLRRLTDSTALDYKPKVSPNGDKIVWGVMGNRYKNIYIMDINGINKKKISSGNDDHDPSF